MMDARRLYPDGWYMFKPYMSRKGDVITVSPTRTEAGGVKYYFIDFGISTKDQSETTGVDGHIRAPELARCLPDGTDEPYDPYKLDVYILGTVYQKFLAKVRRERVLAIP